MRVTLNKQAIPLTISPHFNPYQKLRSELFFSLFYQTFDVIHADTPQLLEQAHRLRYQVFCIENKGYEDPAMHPDKIESDSYDAHSQHVLLIYKPTQTALGTVRNIFINERCPEQSFPLQNLCSSSLLHDESYVRKGCEISRLCISREERLKIKDDLASAPHHIGLTDPSLTRLALALAPIGLIRGCFEMALSKNILNCYGIMEPNHLQKLVKAGLVHKKLGANIDYHGERTPFIMNILETFDHAARNHRDIWNIVSYRGFNHNLAQIVSRKHDLRLIPQH